MIQPAFEILNQRGTPMFFSDIFANRPTAGIIGRIFISTDTAAIYRDTGTTWDLISDAAAGSSNLQQVTNNGATTTLAITTGGLTATNLAGGGSQMVVVNNAGTFGVQAIPTDTNIYNSNGTLTGNRVVSYNGNYLSFAGGKTYIGSQTASSGLLTINNSSGDAHLQVVGTNAPSVRIDNLGSGATQRFVMGLATATNNFIQGSTAGDICISTASASPLLFGMWQSINASEVMRISTSNNVSIGYNVDLGYKLYVNGAIGTNGAITIGNGGSGTSYLYALSGSDLILNAGGDRVTIRQTGNVIINNLSGSGTRMVVADANGVLSTQAVPSGTISGSGTTNYVPKFTGTSAIGNSQVFDNGTNVGISTASPSYKLDIKGANASTLRLDNDNSRYVQLIFERNTTANSGGDFLLDGTNGTFGIRTLAAYPITFSTSSTAGNPVEKMRLDTSGNLCIGSSSAGSTSASLSLSIGSPGTTSGGLQLWAATNQTHYVQFGDGTTGGDPYRGYVGYTQTSDALLFGTSSSERARFSNVGNFLIGTATDNGYKLDVVGTGRFLGSSSDQIRLATAATEDYRIGRNASTGFLDFYGSQTGYVGYVWGGVDGTRMTLNSNGRLGIGTSNPLALLDIASSGNSSIYITAGSTALSRLIFGTTSNNNRGFVDYDNTSASRNMSFKVDEVEAMRITNAQNLLIGGSTDAGYRLDVSGTARISGNTLISTSSNANLQIRSSADAQYIFFTTTSVSDNWLIGTSGSNQSLQFRANAYTIGTGNLRMELTNSGILAIGAISNLGGGNLEVQTNGVSAFTARSSSTTGANGGTTVVAVRSVDSSGSYWANAQYNAWDHIFANTGSSIVMTLKSSGNLLLGCLLYTSPSPRYGILSRMPSSA